MLEPLRFIPPMLPTLVGEPPLGDKWLHEIKHDGFRTELLLNGGNSRAFTRNGLDWSERYRSVLADARLLLCTSALLDGEIIIQDEQGRSDFDRLSLAIEREPERLIFYAFDLLHLDSEDLRNEPLLDRRSRLRGLIGRHDPGFRVQFSDGVIGGGPEFFDVACAAELEGIVSKKASSRYVSGRSKAWRKTKAFIEGEFVVIGHKRDRERMVALLARETGTGLEYAGSAWVTLGDIERERFWRTMQRLESSRPYVPAGVQGVTWVRPEQRVCAKHLRCSGKLRHATLGALVG
jgi:bifunctional non-homologous end joining protein LigD